MASSSNSGNFNVGSVHGVGNATGHGARSHVNIVNGVYDHLQIIQIGPAQIVFNLHITQVVAFNAAPLTSPNPHSVEPELNMLLGRHAELYELLAWVQTACAERKGNWVWLTGPPGTGRKALGRKVQQLLAETHASPAAAFRPLLLSARFWPPRAPQAAQAAQAEPRGLTARDAWAAAVAQALPRAAQAAGPAWVSLLCQLAETLELPALPPELPDDEAGALLGLLRPALAQHTVGVVVLEDLEHAPPTWANLLETLARAAQTLNLVGVATAPAPQPVLDMAATARPPLLAQAAQLAERGLASVWWLGPLDYADFAATAAFERYDAAVPQAIFRLANGLPLWIEKIFLDWQVNGYVEKDDRNCWALAPAYQQLAAGQVADYAQLLIKRALRQAQNFDFTEIEVADLLRCAAIEGPLFTAQAVADACDFDADDVQDFFDEALCDPAGEGRGLLAPGGFVELTLPEADFSKNLFTYRFAPPAAYHVFLHSPTAAEQRALAYRLADALERAYHPFPEKQAPTLARLFALGGPTAPDGTLDTARNARLAYYADLPAWGDELERIRTTIAVLQTLGEDVVALHRLLRLQLDLAFRLREFGHLAESAAVAQATAEMATNQSDRAEADWSTLTSIRVVVPADKPPSQWQYYQALALLRLGEATFVQGDYSATCSYLEHSLALFEKLGDIPGITSALYSLGQVTHSQGRYLDARNYFERSLTLNEKREDAYGMASALQGLGYIAISLADYQSARSYWERSLVLFEKLGNMVGVATLLFNLGNVALIYGDYLTARNCFERSLALTEKTGHMVGIPALFYGLGKTALAQRDYPSARNYLERSLVLNEKMERVSGIANTLQILGDVAQAQNDYPASHSYYERSLAFFEKLGDSEGVADTLQKLGDVASAQRNAPAARSYYERSRVLNEKLGRMANTAEALRNLGIIALSQDDYSAARSYWERSLVLFEKLGNSSWVRLIRHFINRLSSQETSMTNPTPPQPTGNFTVGNITGDNNATGHGANTNVHINTAPAADPIAAAFQPIAEKIQALPASTAKADLVEDTQKIEAEARKGEQADEGRVKRWFAFLAETSKDAYDVALATFVNPILGVGKVFQLIAERAKAERLAADAAAQKRAEEAQ